MGQAAKRRVIAKDPGTKLAHRRLTVLELAERLGDVSEAAIGLEPRPSECAPRAKIPSSSRT